MLLLTITEFRNNISKYMKWHLLKKSLLKAKMGLLSLL